MAKHITKVVLTGGPAAGKTTLVKLLCARQPRFEGI